MYNVAGILSQERLRVSTSIAHDLEKILQGTYKIS
jgi:hypothetical protein